MATSLIPETSIPRLTKLVLMLSSSSDGEALAAVRAIGRALEADGASWHDLATLINPRGSKKEKKVNGTEYDFTIGTEMLFKTLMQCTLTNWEREFVHSVYEQWKRFGRVTKRQAEILARLKKEKNIAM